MAKKKTNKQNDLLKNTLWALASPGSFALAKLGPAFAKPGLEALKFTGEGLNYLGGAAKNYIGSKESAGKPLWKYSEEYKPVFYKDKEDWKDITTRPSRALGEGLKAGAGFASYIPMGAQAFGGQVMPTGLGGQAVTSGLDVLGTMKNDLFSKEGAGEFATRLPIAFGTNVAMTAGTDYLGKKLAQGTPEQTITETQNVSANNPSKAMLKQYRKMVEPHFKAGDIKVYSGGKWIEASPKVRNEYIDKAITKMINESMDVSSPEKIANNLSDKDIMQKIMSELPENSKIYNLVTSSGKNTLTSDIIKSNKIKTLNDSELADIENINQMVNNVGEKATTKQLWQLKNDIRDNYTKGTFKTESSNIGKYASGIVEKLQKLIDEDDVFKEPLSIYSAFLSLQPKATSMVKDKSNIRIPIIGNNLNVRGLGDITRGTLGALSPMETAKQSIQRTIPAQPGVNLPQGFGGIASDVATKNVQNLIGGQNTMDSTQQPQSMLGGMTQQTEDVSQNVSTPYLDGLISGQVPQQSGTTGGMSGGWGEAQQSTGLGTSGGGQQERVGLLMQLINSGMKPNEAIAMANFMIPEQETEATKTASLKDANNAQSGLQALDQLENVLTSNPSLLNAQLLGKGDLASMVGGEDYQNYYTWAYNAADILGRIRTGAQMNEQEIKLYMEQFMPKWYESAEAKQTKINQIREYFNGILNGTVTPETNTTQESDTSTSGLGF